MFPLIVTNIAVVLLVLVDLPLNKILCLHCGVCDGHFVLGHR